MTILDTRAKRWDQTPTRRIATTIHRLRPAPGLGERIERCQQVQSAVYDTTIEHLLRHRGKRWMVSGALDGDSVLKWLTRERHRHPDWAEVPVDVARGAARQAYEAFQRWDEHQQAKALGVLDEQAREDAVREGASPHPNDVPDAERPEHEPAPRAVREWTRPPSEPRRRADGRRALHLLVPGLGRVRVRDTVDPTADIRSCQVVETTHRGTPIAKRCYVLHVQAGSAAPSTGDHAIGDIGVDLGVATTVALSDGRRLRRPDHGAQLLRARGLARHAARRCKRGARQYRKCRRTARRIRREVHRANEHFERHAAFDVIDGQRLVGVESLRLRNLTASGRGTPTAPGSDAKRGLNRTLAERRLAKLGTALERRALKTGCDLVGVHPGNTSITCNRCGHTDKASRRSQALFECMRCGHREHADVNAAGNVRDRARARLDAFHAQRQANHGRRGPSSGSGRSKGQGPATRRTKAVPAHFASRKRGRAAGPRKGMTPQPKTGPPPGVESCM